MWKKNVQLGVERNKFRSFRRSLEKKLISILSGINKNLGQSGIVIKNGIPSSHQHLFSKC
jgi:hypothetical protein